MKNHINIILTATLVILSLTFSGIDIYRSWSSYKAHENNAQLMERSLSRL